MQSRRRWLFALGLSVAGCSNPNERKEVLPMELGEWHRKAVENIPGEQVPEHIKSLGFKHARRAFYQGASNRLQATIFEMNNQTVAFELVQKWRPEEGKIAYHEGSYFVIVDGGDAQQKNSLAKALEGVLKN